MAKYNLDSQSVRQTLSEHILTDGFHIVVDLERSCGSWMHDALTGRKILDFYSYFATLPIGHNHPGLIEDGEFMNALTRAAVANPANSDIYSGEYAAFVRIFGELAKPSEFKYLFFVAGGAPAAENGLKAAFDWKVQLNRAAGREDLGSRVIHFREAFHGCSGYTLSLTNTDPNKTEMFPVFDWPRTINPKLEFPVTVQAEAQVADLERQAVEQMERAFSDHPHDIAAIIIEPIQGEGGDNHFRREFFLEVRRLADEHEALLIFDEVQTGMGLTGKMWAYQHFGVSPDICVFARRPRPAASWPVRGLTSSQGASFKFPAGLTPLGAATWSTWFAAPSTWRLSTRRNWSRTRGCRATASWTGWSRLRIAGSRSPTFAPGGCSRPSHFRHGIPETRYGRSSGTAVWPR